MSEQPNTVTVNADRFQELQGIERRLTHQIAVCNQALVDLPEGALRKAFANFVKMLETVRGGR
jgi:hypothetical protein